MANTMYEDLVSNGRIAVLKDNRQSLTFVDDLRR
jgi:hypothetical protein